MQGYLLTPSKGFWMPPLLGMLPLFSLTGCHFVEPLTDSIFLFPSVYTRSWFAPHLSFYARFCPGLIFTPIFSHCICLPSFEIFLFPFSQIPSFRILSTFCFFLPSQAYIFSHCPIYSPQGADVNFALEFFCPDLTMF